MLTEKRIKEEIKAVRQAIDKLKKIQRDTISGVEVNEIVLKAFEDALIFHNKRD